VDPLGGSWFVETTTNQMEGRIREIVQETDERGGILQAITEGWVQAEVNRQAYARELAIRSGAKKKVGVNVHREEEAVRDVEFHPYRAEQADEQRRRLERVREERDGAAVEAALSRLRAAAESGDNVLPAAIDAVERYATVGEVCDVLRGVYGTYQEPVRF
jgi:methylmalonyl-CoA mutase N-terminal domain/subunit